MNAAEADNNKRDLLLIALMMALAMALRAPLFNIGLTIDDACSAYVIEAPTFSELINRIKEVEMSPPIYFSLLKLCTLAFGINSPVMALPSFIFSVLTVPVVYWLGREANNRNTGLLAAFFAAISLLAVIYSHEARTYAVAGFLTALALAQFMRVLNCKLSLVSAFALAVTCSLLVMTHYISVLYVAIMGLVAIIYRRSRQNKSIYALPALAAPIIPLLAWWPILSYHKSVGTPWADVTPAGQFFNVFASNLSSTLPLPVVAGYLIVTLLCPTLILLAMLIYPKQFLAACKNFLQSPQIVTLAACLACSCALFGYITPYIFGYVRYMTPVACTSWVLLAWIVTAALSPLFASAAASSDKKKLMALKSSATVAMILMTFLSALETTARASQDCSGLRALARDVTANRFGKCAYITAPDFVGIILVYYLKHENGQEKLPEILGFADPSSGLMPPRHNKRADWWHDPAILNLYENKIDDFQRRGFEKIVLIRDTYKPSSIKMPTKEVTDKFEIFLQQKLHKLGATKIYSGRASSYEVSEYAFLPRINAITKEVTDVDAGK